MKKIHSKTTVKQLELPLVTGRNSTNNIKQPPQSRDIQEAELGAIMLEKGAFDKVVEILKAECFYSHFKKLLDSKNLNPTEANKEVSDDNITIKVGWNMYVNVKSLDKKIYTLLASVFVMRVLLIVLKMAMMLLIYWVYKKM